MRYVFIALMLALVGCSNGSGPTTQEVPPPEMPSWLIGTFEADQAFDINKPGTTCIVTITYTNDTVLIQTTIPKLDKVFDGKYTLIPYTYGAAIDCKVALLPTKDNKNFVDTLGIWHYWNDETEYLILRAVDDKGWQLYLDI